jgi:dihydrofolate reductase
MSLPTAASLPGKQPKEEPQMGRIVVTEFVTLDGVIEDPGGSEKTAQGGWAFKYERGDEGDKYKFDELMAADAMLLGRVTYEGFAAAWPNYTDEVGFAAKMNSMPKYVVSSTLESADWENSTILRGNVAEEASKLKAQFAGDVIVHGSASVVQALQDADLVDEYRLLVFPTVLGSGKRLFRDGARPSGMELVEARPAGATAILTLRPVREEAAAAA